MAAITWSAKNNSSFLNGVRRANTMRGAVTAAKRYVEGELYGEGTIIICVDGQPVRIIERSIFTRYRWVSKQL